MENFEKFYNSSLRFLSYRPRSEKEVRDHLKFKIEKSKFTTTAQNSKSKTDADVGFLIDKVIQKLKEKKFINDEEFTKWWIESRLKFKPRSLRLVKIELRQKGILDEIIESGIMNQESGTDLERAKELIKKRIGRFRGLPKQEIYQKLGRYLASKGFSWDIIKKSIDESLDKGV